MILLTRHEILQDGTIAVVPEEIIARFFILMLPDVTLDVASCTDFISSETEPLHGQYPLLIYKHWTIPKQYIFKFFRMVTQIDEKTHTLTPEMTRTINNLTDLITNRLALAIVSQ
jgi:hypothetical protein